jgi:chromosome segregation ATPase
MLQELELINFQGHVHSYFEFHPRFNVIRGTSNHGKSSIIRSILWALENEPYGIDYLNWDKDVKDGFETHMGFEDGSISRIKNKKFNGYRFNTHSIDDTTLEALRADVPSEIRDVTYMDRYNIRGQDDGYFLLQDSAGNVARQLNEKSGLEDIDKVDKISKGLLDEFKTQLRFSKEELEKHNKRKEFLDTFKQFKKPIQDLDDKFEELDDVNKRLKSLTSIRDNLCSIETEMSKLEKVLEHGDDIKVISNLLNRRLKISSKWTSLRLALNDIDKLDTKIEHVLIELEMSPVINDLNLLINEREETINNWKYIQFTKTAIENIEDELGKKEVEIKELDKFLGDLEKKLDGIEYCPVCGADKEYWKHEISH